jgi:hypothetical protein
MPIVDFISQSYESRSRDVSSKRALNFYPQITDGKSKSNMILVGTPGTQTFTREFLSDANIDSINGDGSPLNVVTVITEMPHNYEIGQIINIDGTVNYDELNVEIAFINDANTFTYQTINNDSSDVELIGTVTATGESPVTGIPIDSPCRGLYTTSTGRTFGVFETNVYEFFSDGTWAIRGNPLGSSPNFVSMVDDGRSLVIVDGFIYYVLNLSTNNSQTIDTFAVAGFKNPIKVKFLNQRIVIINNDPDNNPNNPDDAGNNNKFFWTDILDATVIDPLSFASAEQSADPITSLEVRDGELWLFGPRSYEVWRNDSNPDLPYAFVGGAATEIGCGAPDSVTTIAGNIFWLGSSNAGENVVYMSNGYNAQRISNHAIEYFLNTKGSTTSDSVGFTYQQEGHIFFILNLIQANKTLVYDLTSNLWHERSTREKTTNTQNRWAPLFATFNFDQIITGDGESPRLFTLDLDRYIEYDGRPIVREFVSPVYYQDYRECFHKDFQVDLETGIGLQFGLPNVGIQQGQGTNPQIMLQYSDDGGHTYSSERWTSMGKVGQYRSKARWRSLGRSSERVYKLRISDPVKCILIGARIIMDTSRNR